MGRLRPPSASTARSGAFVVTIRFSPLYDLRDGSDWLGQSPAVRCSGGRDMKAVAVFPGRARSAHLADLPEPQLESVPGERGVLVRVLRVGLDGTDKEINAGAYGIAPAGADILVIGHESLGVVEEVGPAVAELQPGDPV